MVLCFSLRGLASGLAASMLACVVGLTACGGGGSRSTPAQTAPTFSAQPSNQVVTAGNLVTFTASANGNPTPTYQWERSADGTNWAALAAVTSSSYTFTAQAADNGALFRIKATNSIGTATSSVAAINVHYPPAFTVQPTGQTVTAGASVNLHANASSNPTPSYQWERSADGGIWEPISGETNETLNFTAQAGDNGSHFRVKASNELGAVTSSTVTTVVNFAPFISRQPASISAPWGSSAVFAVEAQGNPSPSFQWELSSDGGRTWISIPGAVGQQYPVGPLHRSDDGTQFRVVAANLYGATSSFAAVISLSGIPNLQLNAQSVSLDPLTTQVVTATVGTPQGNLVWTLVDGQGALASNGDNSAIFTAPKLWGQSTVRAVLAVDPSISADLTLFINRPQDTTAGTVIFRPEVKRLDALVPAETNPTSLVFDGTPSELAGVQAGDVIVVGTNAYKVRTHDVFENSSSQVQALKRSSLALRSSLFSPYVTALGVGPVLPQDTIASADTKALQTLTGAALKKILLASGGSLEFEKMGLTFEFPGTVFDAQGNPHDPTYGLIIKLEDVVLYDKDGDEATTNDQITASGEIGLDLVAESQVVHDPLGGRQGFNQLHVGGSLSYKLTFKIKAEFKAPETGEPFLRLKKIGPIPIQAGPVVFNLYPIDFFLQAKASADVSLAFEGEVGIDQTITKHFDTGRTEVTGDGITSKKEFKKPVLSGNAEASIFLGIGPAIDVSVGTCLISGGDWAGICLPVGLRGTLSGHAGTDEWSGCMALNLTAEPYAYLRYPTFDPKKMEFDVDTISKTMSVTLWHGPKFGICEGKAPIPSVKGNFNPLPGMIVVLDASTSWDFEDSSISSFAWEWVGGTKVELVGANSAVVQFTAPAVGSRVDLRLMVTDSDEKSASRVFSVWVGQTAPPEAVIVSPYQKHYGMYETWLEASQGQTILLDGSLSRSREGGNIVEYSWKQLGGPKLSLNDPYNAYLSFQVREMGTYSFQLEVVDEARHRSTSCIEVRVGPPPSLILHLESDYYSVAPGGTLDLRGILEGDFDGKGLTWAVETPGGGSVVADTNTIFATYTAPATEGTYVVTAKAVADSRVITKTHISVCQLSGMPVIKAFKVTPLAITAGGSLTLSWDTSNSRSIKVTVKGLLGQGNAVYKVSPAGTRLHKLDDLIWGKQSALIEATNEHGTISQSVDFQVGPPGSPTIKEFTAARTQIRVGESTELIWIGASGDSLSINPGVGVVTGENGRVTIHPSATTTYTLTAINAVGSMTASVNVEVVTTTAPSRLNVTIATGGIHSLIRRTDGTVWTWGGKGDLGGPLPSQVQGLTDVTAVGAGSTSSGGFSAALKSDGTVWTWGANSHGYLGNPTIWPSTSIPTQVPGMEGVVGLSVSNWHTLALKSDGTIWAWGYGARGELGDGASAYYSTFPVQVVGLVDAIAVSAGEHRSLALKSDGTVWAWGAGPLGDGTQNSSSTPIQVPGLESIQAVAAGGSHSLALGVDGSVWTWGKDQLLPTRVPDLPKATGIACGSDFGLALLPDGTVWAWGSNSSDELGDGTRVSRLIPARIQDLANVVAITAASGGPRSIALTSQGEVWEWGGMGGTLPRCLSGLPAPVVIAGGAMQSIAAGSDGSVWAWGQPFYWEDPYFRSAPTQVVGPTDVVAVSAGATHCLALGRSGTVWAWGSNWTGALGDGTEFSRLEPLQVQGLPTIASVSAGRKGHYASLAGEFNLALGSDGTVWSWGGNEFGQLGDGTQANRLLPVQVMGLAGVSAVATGYLHSLALKSDGTVWAWGSNIYGDPGDGTQVLQLLPSQVQGLQDIVAIAAGDGYSLAIKSDGAVWAWGSNRYGQLGVGADTPYIPTPTQVLGLSNVISVSAGRLHTIALKSDGSVWVWGYSYDFALGLATPANLSYLNAPVRIPDITGASAIAAGYASSLVLTPAGLFAWGNGGSWELGLGKPSRLNLPQLLTARAVTKSR